MQAPLDFTITKSAVIKDWRLGLLMRLLQVAVVSYVLTDIFIKASYLLHEVPTGVIWPSVGLSLEQRRGILTDQRDNYGDFDYCTNPDAYSYTLEDASYRHISCVIMDPLAISEQGESRFFVTTFFTLDKLFYIRRGNRRCLDAPDIDNIPDEAEKLGKFSGSCLYTLEEQYFPINPESTALNIVHSFFTSVVGKSGSLPETVFRGRNLKGGREMKLAKGAGINVDLRMLLDIAGVDLTKPLNEQPNPGTLSKAARGTNEQYPRARLSGVNIVVSFEYYHRALAPHPYREWGSSKWDDVICLVELEPRYDWTFLSSDVRYQVNDVNQPFFVRPNTTGSDYNIDTIESIQVNFRRHGVQLSFQVSGNLGVFDFFSLVDALVAGAVLLGVAQLIVTYVALYALGLSSQLYMEFMRESVNWRKEYARFGVQCLVAGSTFLQFDKNKSGTLDRREIYVYLTEVLKEILEDSKIASLTDFLMRHSEKDVDVSVGRLEELSDVKQNTINMAEWVDIFTEEKVQISSLARLVDTEYKDKKIIDILLRLAEGRTVRELQVNPSRAESGVALFGETSTPEERLLDDGGVSHQDGPNAPVEGESGPTGRDDSV